MAIKTNPMNTKLTELCIIGFKVKFSETIQHDSY